jgi:hypothetical protein
MCSGDDGTFGMVDCRVLWQRLTLNREQVARLTGIPGRRISQWVERGWLIPCSRNPTRYNGQTVEQAILLERALARGVRPEHAIYLIRKQQLRLLPHRDGGVRADSQSEAHQRLAHEFAEAALRMLLLDVLEGYPDSPRSA